MAKKEARLHVHVDEETREALRERSVLTGAPVGELVRRFINLGLFADQQSEKKTSVFIVPRS